MVLSFIENHNHVLGMVVGSRLKQEDQEFQTKGRQSGLTRRVPA
jgi:hypothetical protein